MIKTWLNSLAILLIYTTTVHADFRVLGGNVINQKGGTGQLEYDTDNDGSLDIVMSREGNLGIGTTAPSGNLEIIGNAFINPGHIGIGTLTTNGLLEIKAANATEVPQIIELAASHTGNALEINSNSATGGDLVAITPAGQIRAQSFRIGTGDVELNNSSLSLVNGSGRLQWGNNGTHITGLAASHITFQIGYANRVRFDNSGYVGIGTTAPTGNLHVVGNAQIDSHLSFLDLSSAPAAQTGNNLLYTVSSNLFYLDSSGSEFQLTNNGSEWTLSNGNVYRSSGFVGVGNTMPEGMLQIDPLAATNVGLVVKAHAAQSGNMTEWVNAGGAIKAHITDAGEFSNATSATSEQFGAGATANANGTSVAIGSNATGGQGGTSIGSSATTSAGFGVAVGASANAGSATIAIGNGANASTAGSGILIGAFASNPNNFSMVFGRSATSTATSQIVFSNGGYPTTDMYLGYGVTYSAPDDFTINASGGAGTNISGANIQIAGGKGTGNALPGHIAFMTSDEGASGTTLQSLSERVRIDADGNLGIGLTAPTQKLMIAGNIVASSANTYSLGTSALSWDNVYSKDFTMLSDRRLKSGIQDLNEGLGEIMKLRPVSFAWKGQPSEERTYGLIAQEVQQVLEDAVNVGEDTRQTLGVHYSNLVPVLIKATQEQQKLIEQHKLENAQQSKLIKKLMKTLDLMQGEIRLLKNP